MDPQHVWIKTVWHLFQFGKAELQGKHFPCPRSPVLWITCKRKYSSGFHDVVISLYSQDRDSVVSHIASLTARQGGNVME